MPPPSLNRRPSMPVLNVVRDEPQQLERTRSLAAAGRSPTLGSIRSARQRAGSIAAPSADADEGGSAAAEPVHFATRHEDDVVRPPSRINSARSGAEDGAAAPAVAPQKVLVKRLKSTTAAQRSTMPNPAAHHSSRFSGDEVDSHQGSVNVPSDSDARQNSGRQHWSDGATNFVAFAGNSGYRSGGDGGESDPYQVVPVSLVGSGGEEERTVTSARGGGGDDVTSQHPRSASASHTAPQPHHSRTSSVNNQSNNNNHTTFHADDQYSRGAVYGDVGVRSTPDHWASSAPPVTVASQATVDTTSHAPNDIYNPARSVGTVQSQRMIFESSGQPLIRPVAASGGTPPPPPPPPNWKAGDTPRTATGTSPPPPPPLPPPPRRVDNYDLDQKSLPDAASVRSKVEQHHAREVARMEAERLQQPGRPSLTTFSRLDLGSRLGRGDDDDGQYSLFTDNGVPDSARTLDESMKQEQQGVSHANVAAETPPSSVRHQSSHEKRSSPSRMQSASARGFIPVSPIAFSIEFDGMNAVLLDQLSDASLNRIVDELQSVLYDAVRGPVPSKGSIRVERVLASEDSDSRTVVEGFIRGMRSASDRRLAIRLLVSYFRGPSADAIGLRLVQFPALVRDANAVSVRRMYINDVDVALLSLSSAQNSPTNNNNNHQKSLDHGQGSLAAFEARRTKLSMTSTPSIIGAEYHTNGTPREVSPLRYPDRPLYHHITTPTPSSQKAVGGQQQYNPANSLAPMTPNAGAYHDPMRSPPVQQPQPNYSNGSQLRPGQTDVVPYYSPSNNYGVTRYRTRKYEYH